MSTRTFLIARRQLLERKRSMRRTRQHQANVRETRALRAQAEEIACRELFAPLWYEILNKERVWECKIFRARRAMNLMRLITGDPGWTARHKRESTKRLPSRR